VTELARTFGENLRFARRERGITQAHLRAVAGVCHSALSGAENGRYGVSLETALRLAAAVGVTISELTGEVPMRVVADVRDEITL
jgi:transcriptional regulator with XRE-family HTH domain